MLVAGLDECGAGAIAGPIVAACVLVDLPVSALMEVGKAWPIPGVGDSKQLSAGRRRKLSKDIYAFLIDSRGDVGIGVAHVGYINKHGHMAGWRYAMREALRLATEEKTPHALVVDGTQDADLPFPIESTLYSAKADSLFFPVAAASILGKVFRDDIMDGLSHYYEGYGWEKSKGYPTEDHLSALTRLGPTDQHRAKAATTAMSGRPTSWR